MSEVVRYADDAAEASDMTDAAETLGLSLNEAVAVGAWETQDGHPIHPRSGGIDVRDPGRTYFTADVRGPDGEETVRMKPVDGAAGRDGQVRLTFTTDGDGMLAGFD